MPIKKPARPKGGKAANKKPAHTAGKAKPAQASPKKAIAKSAHRGGGKPAKPTPKRVVDKKSTSKKPVKKSVAKLPVKKAEHKISKPATKEHSARKQEAPGKSLVSVKPIIKPVLKKE